jgi:hypothetical protein
MRCLRVEPIMFAGRNSYLNLEQRAAGDALLNFFAG